jgi:hypothetical protein
MRIKLKKNNEIGKKNLLISLLAQLEFRIKSCGSCPNMIQPTWSIQKQPE